MTTYHTFFLFKQSHILRRTAISGAFQVLRSESVWKEESGHDEHAKLQQVPLGSHQSFHAPQKGGFPSEMPRRAEQNFVLREWSPHPLSWEAQSRLEIILASTAVVLHHFPENCFPGEARRPAQPHPCLPTLLVHSHNTHSTAGFFPQSHSERDECILKIGCTVWKAQIRKWSIFSTVYYFLIILAHLPETDSSPSNNKRIHMEYW